MHIKYHNYSRNKDPFTVIDQQIADDIGWVLGIHRKFQTHPWTTKDQYNKKKLKERNLKVNREKTEFYTVNSNGKYEWKICEYLRSRLDTKEDIKKRTQLANNT